MMKGALGKLLATAAFWLFFFLTYSPVPSAAQTPLFGPLESESVLTIRLDHLVSLGEKTVITWRRGTVTQEFYHTPNSQRAKSVGKQKFEALYEHVSEMLLASFKIDPIPSKKVAPSSYLISLSSDREDFTLYFSPAEVEQHYPELRSVIDEINALAPTENQIIITEKAPE